MTTLCYFRNCKQLCGPAKVTKFIAKDAPGEGILRLDRTYFYPQGGGQPSDKGNIFNDSFRFEVQKVVHAAESKEVDHIGAVVDGEPPSESDPVTAAVDENLRLLHNRLHSGGHIIDAAVLLAGYTHLVAAKAYHVPDGPYVEYTGEISVPKEDFIKTIQEHCDRLIADDLKVYIDYANDDYEDTSCERKMRIADIISIPCGGTHVDSLAEIGKMTIRKVESKKGKTKVAYQVF
jgi:Ser-tRNA(Ala) deacylase AlaX